MPLPKSAAAATRQSGEVGSPATSGTRRRIQSVAGPGRSKPPGDEAMLDRVGVEGGSDDPVAPGREGLRAPPGPGWRARTTLCARRQGERDTAETEAERACYLAVARAQRGLDDLHLPPRPRPARRHGERDERHRAEQLDRQARHLHLLAALEALRRARQERCGRTPVLRLA